MGGNRNLIKILWELKRMSNVWSRNVNCYMVTKNPFLYASTKEHHCYMFDRADAEKQPLNAMVDRALQEKQWDKEDKEFSQFACSLKLCVAFAANVGGVGTLIGCGPNIVLKGQVDS